MFNWVTDRYPPHSFTDYVIHSKKLDVIGIEISTAEGFGSRPGQDFTFYNTQGKGHYYKTPAPVGTSVASSLYIPASWGDPTQGSRRTDMWVETYPANTDYAIVGFTNYGGPPRFRIWTENGGGQWIDLSTPISYDTWTDLRIEYTGTEWQYFINDTLAQSSPSLSPGELILDVKLEAYNFTGDPSITGAFAGNPLGNYTAYWTNPFPLPDVVIHSTECVPCAARRARIKAIIDYYKALFGL